MLDIPPKATLAQVGETVVSRCFVGCLGQARDRCSNRCCCGLRNYVSDVRPTDPLGAGVESPNKTLAPVVVLCTSTAGLKYIKKLKQYQPTDRGGSSFIALVCIRHAKKYWTSKIVVSYIKFYFTFDFISLYFVAAKGLY